MKKYFFFLILIILIFISGCGTSLPGRGSISNDGPLTGSPNGLQIIFLSQVSDILSGNSVQVPIKLRNNAACDAMGELCLTDTAPDGISGSSPLCQEDGFSIPGAVIEGNKQRILEPSFYLQTPAYSINDPKLKNREYTLSAAATYKCEIVARPEFCVTRLSDDKTCKSSEIITGSNLNAAVAPITVTQIEKITTSKSSGADVLIRITLSKMSKGYVVDKVIKSTETQLESLQGEPVSFYADIDGNQMECSGTDFNDNIIRWKASDNQRIINCKTSLNFPDNNIEAHLNVNLDFTYKITESKKINVINQNYRT